MSQLVDVQITYRHSGLSCAHDVTGYYSIELALLMTVSSLKLQTSS